MFYLTRLTIIPFLEKGIKQNIILFSTGKEGVTT
jgi:hypothetical protein